MGERAAPGPMDWTLFRQQLGAVAAGGLLTVVLGVAILGLSRFDEPFRRLWAWLPLASRYGPLAVLPVLFAYGVARRCRRHPFVALLTCAVPALLQFGAGYAGDLLMRARIDAERHTIHNIIGYADPFDVAAQARVALPALGWVAVTALAGIGLARWRREDDGGVREPAGIAAHLPFLVLSLALFGAAVFGLVRFAEIQYRANTPEGRVAAAAKALESPAASEDEKLRDVSDLWEVRTPEASRLLRQAARGSSARVRARAGGILFAWNDPETVSLLEKALAGSPDAQAELQKMGVPLDAYVEHVRDPAVIPAVAEMMRSPAVEVRRRASQALRQLRRPEAVDALVAGLDDPDWDVRWHCVLGLGEFVGVEADGKEWAPADEEFRKNEPEYIDHWKAWAARRAAPLPSVPEG